MILILDTSAFVKLFVEETGSVEAARAFAEANAALASQIVYIEARAAIARRVERPGPRLRGDLERIWAGLGVIQLDERLARRAGDVAEQRRLRGMDALQLASAVHTAETVSDEVVFATWDADLAAAARAERLTTLPAA